MKKSLLDIWKMMEKLNGTISNMDKNLMSRMDALEVKFESLVSQKVSALEVEVCSRIKSLEKDLKEMKKSKPTAVATANNKEDDEATSKAPVSFICCLLSIFCLCFLPTVL